MASILVIADDLTGAAELGGVALRYDLSVMISHSYKVEFMGDVQIINTNTRSLSLADAQDKIRDLFEQVDFSKFDWIYLKFDSALRGHIYEEISLYQCLLKAVSVSVCPVNPLLGRVIRDGKYWVGDRLISQTSFANDPEFPIQQDDVMDILGATDWTLQQVKRHSMLAGVNVWQVESLDEMQDVAKWSAGNRVFAGASAYFHALLSQHFVINETSIDPSHFEIGAIDQQRSVLYVCGSTHANSKNWLAKQPLPDLVYWDNIDPSIDERIITLLNEKSKAIFAYANHVDGAARVLRLRMAKMVKRVFDQYEVRELCIEGGATSFEILKELEIDTFFPVQELASGVVRSKVDNKDLYITLKPGSYQWSASLQIF